MNACSGRFILYAGLDRLLDGSKGKPLGGESSPLLFKTKLIGEGGGISGTREASKKVSRHSPAQ